MYRQGLGTILWIFFPNALIQNNFKSTALFIFFLPHYASLLGCFTSRSIVIQLGFMMRCWDEKGPPAPCKTTRIPLIDEFYKDTSGVK